MAKPPTLVRDTDGDWKVAASFETGRYRFTLGSAGERLLRGDLGYQRGDRVPFELFRTLVYAGDAWLPGSPERPIEAGDDLAEPYDPGRMTDEEGQALADHLRGRRVGDRQRSALRDQLDRTPLGRYLALAALRRTDEWVETLPATAEGTGANRDDGRAATPAGESSGGGATATGTGADVGDEPATPDQSATAAQPAATDGAAGTNDPAAEDGPAATGEPADGGPKPAVGSDVEVASVSYLAELEAATAPGFEAFPTDRLADAYALLSEIESRVGDLRTDVREVLADRIAEGREVSGRIGTVRGASRTRRSLRDDEDVLAAVERNGFPRDAVLTEQVDESELEGLVEEAGVDESAFYEVSDTEYVRRVDLDVSTIERVASGDLDAPATERTAPGGHQRPTTDRAGADEVACPVEGCPYRGEPASVAAHVSGVHDDDHDWNELPYSGRTDFLGRQ